MYKIFSLVALLYMISLTANAQRYLINLGKEIQGDCQVENYEGWIEIRDFTYSVYRELDQESRTVQSDSPAFSDLSFSKQVDASTVDINKHLSEGLLLREVTVHALNQEGTTVLLSYKFYGVTLTNYNITMFQGDVPGEYINMQFKDGYRVETNTANEQGEEKNRSYESRPK